MIMYKLVSQEYTSYGGMKWEIGVTNTAAGGGKELCSDGLLHCYEDPYLTIIFNPIHADIVNPRLLEIECSEIIAEDNLKFGCKEQTPIRELQLPVIATEQKVEFAIRVVLKVYRDKEFVIWAERWLSGKDRSERTAWAAWAAAAEARAWAAEAAAAGAKAWAAAEVKAWAAAEAAEAAARAAARAARAAKVAAAEKIDFKNIIHSIVDK